MNDDSPGPIPLWKLTRVAWVKYEWLDVTPFGSADRMLLRGRERTPDEGAAAVEQWDKWYKAIKG